MSIPTITTTPNTSEATTGVDRHFDNTIFEGVSSYQFNTPFERFLQEGPQELLTKILASISTAGAFYTCRPWHEYTQSPAFYSEVLENLLKNPLTNRLFENLLPTAPTVMSDKERVQRIFQELSSYFPQVVPPKDEKMGAHLHILSPKAHSRSCCYTIAGIFELKASLLTLAALPKVQENSDIEESSGTSRLYFDNIFAPLRKPSHKKGTLNEHYGIIQHPYLYERSGAIFQLLEPEVTSSRYPSSLSLRNIQLVHFCEPLFLMKNMKKLDLSKNLLMALPTTFTKLTNLQALKLSENNFFHFPSCVYQLPKLQNLQAQNIRINTLPPGIQALSFLRLLDLSHNDLETLPAELSQNKSLEVLLLSHNKLTSLPSIDDLPKLQVLDVSHNRLELCPEPHPQLRVLNIAYNLLSTKNALHVDPFTAFENLDYLHLTNNPLLKEEPELAELAEKHPLIHQLHNDPRFHCPKEDIPLPLHMRNITYLIFKGDKDHIPTLFPELIAMRHCNEN